VWTRGCNESRRSVALKSPSPLVPTVFPKEHGAYGQLLFPLLTALAIGRRTPSALLLAGAAVLAFIAHEPLLVLLGQRGPRAAREQRSRAIAWFGVAASGAAILGAAAIVEARAGTSFAGALIVPLALALVLAIAIASRREHTAAGEILAALTFSSIAFPVARAAGAAQMVALTCALVFAAIFVAATMCVHAVIARTRHPPAVGARAAGVLIAIGSIAALWLLGRVGLVSTLSFAAALPACAVAMVAALGVRSAKRLRPIGWSLIVTTLMAAALLIVAFG
jgi:YwiC-like protein